MPKYRGHLLNWYDTRTLKPLSPQFVSSVDSGNLVASLWTLQQGCLDRLRQPLLQPSLAQGLLDYLRVLTELRAFPTQGTRPLRIRLRRRPLALDSLLQLDPSVFDQVQPPANSKYLADIEWLRNEARDRLLNHPASCSQLHSMVAA